MWYAVETAFIEGRWYKSMLMFDPWASQENARALPGVCYAGHDECPHNTCQTFMGRLIEIHVDWFQTKEQAIEFMDGKIGYAMHFRTWYDRGIRSMRSEFIKWEPVKPPSPLFSKFRGVCEHHYDGGKEHIMNVLLHELKDAENDWYRDGTYRSLEIIGIDRETADMKVGLL